MDMLWGQWLGILQGFKPKTVHLAFNFQPNQPQPQKPPKNPQKSLTLPKTPSPKSPTQYPIYPNSQQSIPKPQPTPPQFSPLPLPSQMKQQILNYETDLIQKQLHYTQTHFHPNDPHNYRYGTWNLLQTIETYVSNIDYTIKWIGCDGNAHVLAFFYCMLMGCLDGHRHGDQDDFFVRFKYGLYQESKQVLSITQQKIFVEHLGLIEDSKNIAQFLKKSNHLETILIKIFSQKCSQMTRKPNKSSTSTSSKYSKFQQLQWYSAIFPFNNFQVLGERCATLMVNKQVYYIVEEKECYFVVQEVNNQLVSCRISEVSNRKKTKTEIYGQGLQYIDSLKSFQMLQSKHQQPHQPTIIKSSSKQYLPITLQDKKHKNSDQHIQTQPHEEDRVQMRHNFFANKRKQTQGQYPVQLQGQSQGQFQAQADPWVNISKTNTNSSKQDLLVDKEKQRKFDMNDLRTSVKDDRYYRIIGTPKIASERVSADKEHKSKGKSKRYTGKYQQVLPTQMPQILQNQLSQTNRQNNFIYQSLNPSQQLQQLQKQLTPKQTHRVPKFLAKRIQQSVPYTFSSSPIKANVSPPPNRNIIRKQKSAVFSAQQISMSLNPALMANLAKQGHWQK